MLDGAAVNEQQQAFGLFGKESRESVRRFSDEAIGEVDDGRVIAHERGCGLERPEKVRPACLDQVSDGGSGPAVVLHARADGFERRRRGHHRDLGDSGRDECVERVADDRTIGDALGTQRCERGRIVRGCHDNSLGRHADRTGAGSSSSRGYVVIQTSIARVVAFRPRREARRASPGPDDMVGAVQRGYRGRTRSRARGLQSEAGERSHPALPRRWLGDHHVALVLGRRRTAGGGPLSEDRPTPRRSLDRTRGGHVLA